MINILSIKLPSFASKFQFKFQDILGGEDPKEGQILS